MIKKILIFCKECKNREKESTGHKCEVICDKDSICFVFKDCNDNTIEMECSPADIMLLFKPIFDLKYSDGTDFDVLEDEIKNTAWD